MNGVNISFEWNKGDGKVSLNDLRELITALEQAGVPADKPLGWNTGDDQRDGPWFVVRASFPESERVQLRPSELLFGAKNIAEENQRLADWDAAHEKKKREAFAEFYDLNPDELPPQLDKVQP